MREGSDLERSVSLTLQPTYYGSLMIEPTVGRSKCVCSRASVFSVVSQVGACFGKYLCMINIGLTASLPLILIPLSTKASFHIKFTQDDIKSLVSILFIMMPIGAVLAALPIKVKRKPPLILTQAIIFATWIGIYYSTKAWHVIMARAFGGLAITLSQPHITSYIGEVTVPQLRGILGSLTQTMALLGEMIMSNLLHLHSWNGALVICGSIALFSMFYLFCIPESPILLISYGEYKKAFRSLKRLRGGNWSDKKAVNEEFEQLMKNYAKAENNSVLDIEKSSKTNGVANYAFEFEDPKSDFFNGISKKCHKCSLNYQIGVGRNIFLVEDLCVHQKDEKIKNLQPNQNTSTEKHEEDDDSLIPWNKYILMPKMYKPLLIVVVSAMFVVGPGSHGVTQYLQYVLYGFNLSDHYNILLSIVTSSMLAGNIVSICVVSKLGKKRIILLSTVGAGLGYVSLGVVSCIGELNVDIKVSLVSCLLGWTIFMEEFGIKTLYHSLLTELFPMRGKRIGPVVYVLVVCVNGVAIGQMYIDVLADFGVIAILIFNSLLCFFGTIFFYYIFIETEGKTLKEIENSFQGKSFARKG